jgi:hypothetical protein
VLIELIKSEQFIKMTVKLIVLSVIIVSDLVKQVSENKIAQNAKDEDHEEEYKQLECEICMDRKKDTEL